MKTKIIFLLPLFCLSALFVNAHEYHIAIDGDDRAAGSEEAPFRTISRAALIAEAGDTITVHEGIYREWVKPLRGGNNDLHRILYRAAPGEIVVIKGSEVVQGWERVQGSVWQVRLPNAFFGDYNPFNDVLKGDWLDSKGMVHHTGEVYLNGISLFERSSLQEVIEAVSYPDARDPEASTYTWYAEVDSTQTTLWANFQGYDPNEELVEVNVRPACFYPERPGIDYITVRGFIMDQAATQWAAPTAEQPGLIGTHWSKGWIIEQNVVSNSKSVGITMGKDRSTGHNVWMNNPVKDGATHYNEVIFRALAIGWSEENIGSHIVRNNVISDCGQAGIVGSLGAVFSRIQNNHIYDIWTKRTFAGAEMAGIKIHASIDMLIKNNRIHNTGRGIWIDWMAQGTRISGNLLYDNTTDDLFSEVNHGPYLVDNNLFLSMLSLRDWSEGGAFVHNLFAGAIEVRPVRGRFTPYHFPHSTRVAGLRNIYCGDNRFYNNIFLHPGDGQEVNEENRTLSYGLKGYHIAGFENHSAGNVYFQGAQPGEEESSPVVIPGRNPGLAIQENDGHVFLTMDIEDLSLIADTRIITTSILGSTLVSEAVFEQSDGSPYRIDRDYFNLERHARLPVPGPIEALGKGKSTIQVW